MPTRTRRRTNRHRALFGALLATCLVAAGATPAAAASYPDAVLLVSGFDSATPFTTPAPACSGQEGGTWAHPGGVPAALRAASLSVFTAPVRRGTTPLPSACAPGGTPTPSAAMTIDSHGDVDTNGAALARYIAFLRDQYGVQRLRIVAHSDGGIWTRSALTQDAAYAGVRVESLTTLGTPYTGSAWADLGVTFANEDCSDLPLVERLACDFVKDTSTVLFDALGTTAGHELTYSYTVPWNARQTIGQCPVNAIAGTHVSLGSLLNRLFPRYYLPSDGLVGLASANAQTSRSLSGAAIPGPSIPGLHLVGSFDIIHTPALESVFHATALTDTPAVSAAAVTAVTGTPAGGPTCNPGETATPPRTAAVTVPLHSYRAARGGALPRPRTGDVVVTGANGRVRCSGRSVALLAPPVPSASARRPRLWLPQGCTRSLRVSGRALLVRFRTVASLRGRTTDGTLRVRAQGARIRSAELREERATRFHRVRLGPGGTLPSVRAPGATLRVRAVRHGHTLRAQAFVPGG